MILPASTPLQWTMAAIAALCIGLSKSGFPGIAMISVLLMAELMPARQSTGVILPLLICGDFLAVGTFRRHVRWPYVWRTLPPAVAGIVLGFFLLKLPLSENFFRILIGGVILALVLLQAARSRLPSLDTEIPAGGPAALGLEWRAASRPWSPTRPARSWPSTCSACGCLSSSSSARPPFSSS